MNNMNQLHKTDSHNYQNLWKLRSLKAEELTSEMQKLLKCEVRTYMRHNWLNPSKKQAAKLLDL